MRSVQVSPLHSGRVRLSGMVQIMDHRSEKHREAVRFIRSDYLAATI